MDAQKFLRQFIQDQSEYMLTKEDKQTIRTEGVGKFIFNKLNSSKYRASGIDEDYKTKVIDKINLCIDHQIPIYVTLPFGANKNPNLRTAPQIDWAEIFNLSYVRSYLKPIAKAYKYGVVIDYISVAVFQETVNYIQQRDTNLYDRQFSELVSYFQKYYPPNLELKFSRVSDQIKRSKIERMLAIKKSQLRKVWDKQIKKVRDYKIFRAARNCIINPKAKNKNQLLLESALGHDAFCSEYWTTDATPWDKKQMITLGHRYTKGWAIHFRSAPGSTVNFWSGIGLLQQRRDRYVPTVLSPTQFKKIETKLQKIPIDLFAKNFNNLQQVLIY